MDYIDFNEIILMAIVITIVLGDLIFAYLKINEHGLDSHWVGSCPNCGKEIADPLIIKWLIKRLIHRCEDNLI